MATPCSRWIFGCERSGDASVSPPQHHNPFYNRALTDALLFVGFSDIVMIHNDVDYSRLRMAAEGLKNHARNGDGQAQSSLKSSLLSGAWMDWRRRGTKMPLGAAFVLSSAASGSLRSPLPSLQMLAGGVANATKSFLCTGALHSAPILRKQSFTTLGKPVLQRNKYEPGLGTASGTKSSHDFAVIHVDAMGGHEYPPPFLPN